MPLSYQPDGNATGALKIMKTLLGAAAVIAIFVAPAVAADATPAAAALALAAAV